MHKGFLKTGAFFGALSVILGAFAAHSIKEKVAPDVLAIFETGVRYQFYHAFALLAVGMLYAGFPGKTMLWAGRLFTAGILLFSGSLYLLTWLKASGNTDLRWAGIITPFGGAAFIAGWVCMMLSFYKPAVKDFE